MNRYVMTALCLMLSAGARRLTVSSSGVVERTAGGL